MCRRAVQVRLDASNGSAMVISSYFSSNWGMQFGFGIALPANGNRQFVVHQTCFIIFDKIQLPSDAYSRSPTWTTELTSD